MRTKLWLCGNLAWTFLYSSPTSTCPESMDGLKPAHAVRDRWPPIKILLGSGHVRPQASELPSNSCLVAKPYRAAATVEQLRSIVSSA